MQLGKLKLAILTASLAGAMSASASFAVYEIGVSPGEVVGFHSSLPYDGGAYAGIYNLRVGSMSAPITPSFCIDAWHYSPNGAGNSDYDYKALGDAPTGPGGPMGATAATTIEQLWANYFDGISTKATQAEKNFEAAALQVAIWTTVYNGDQNKNNTFSVDNADVVARANDMLEYRDTTKKANLMALLSPTTQSYVVPIPEPTTLIAGALLLLPFGASTLRFVRKNRAA